MYEKNLEIFIRLSLESDKHEKEKGGKMGRRREME